MSTSSSGSPGSSSGTVLPPDTVPGDSGLAADAQAQDRARLQAYQRTMSDLDSNQTVVSDMQAYEKATQQELDDLHKEIQHETQYLNQHPGLSPSASSELRSSIKNQLLLIQAIMKQRDAVSDAQAQNAEQWGQQYAGIAPYTSGSASSSGTASSSGRAAHHHARLASYPPGVVTNAAKIQPGTVQSDPSGFASGKAAFIAYANQALTLMGITSPTARQNWMKGLLTAAQRESSYNPYAINLSDSNAAAGDPSRGLMQTIATTFAAYHEPGTSQNIYNPVANITAAMNYVMSRYGVNRNGSNLAQLVPQFNPNDAPQGY